MGGMTKSRPVTDTGLITGSFRQSPAATRAVEDPATPSARGGGERPNARTTADQQAEEHISSQSQRMALGNRAEPPNRGATRLTANTARIRASHAMGTGAPSPRFAGGGRKAASAAARGTWAAISSRVCQPRLEGPASLAEGVPPGSRARTPPGKPGQHAPRGPCSNKQQLTAGLNRRPVLLGSGQRQGAPPD